MKGKPLPEVVLIRKTYPRYRRKIMNRNWKLEKMPVLEKENFHARKADKAKADYEEELFMRDIEEDEEMRGMVNIYKNNTGKKRRTDAPAKVDEESDVEDDFPEIKLEEMLDQMQIRDVEMLDATPAVVLSDPEDDL